MNWDERPDGCPETVCPGTCDHEEIIAGWQQNAMAFLTLSHGAALEGRRIGAPADRIGELVFSTGMTGCLETLTDPSYYGQIVTQSFPLDRTPSRST